MPHVKMSLSVDQPSGAYWVEHKELAPGEALVVTYDATGLLVSKVVALADVAGVAHVSKVEKDVGLE